MRFLIIVALLCSSAVAQHPSVCIVGITQGNTEGQGTGCIISNNAETDTVLVLTAAHVVEGRGRVWANPPGTGKRFYATSAIRRHPTEDLAIFAVPRAGLENREPMRLWTGKLTAGLEVYSEGFGNVSEWPTQAIGKPIWTKGIYAFARLKGKIQPSNYTNQNIIDCSLPSIPGDSGSPIFLSYQGNPYLIGVTSGSNWANSSGFRQVPTATTASHIGPIRDWISTLGWRVRRARDQAHEYTYGTRVDTSGCVIFGRGTIFGRSHPAPYQGQQCIPGQGCVPMGGGSQIVEEAPDPILGQHPAPQYSIPEPIPPPAADPRFDELMKQQREMLDQLKQRQQCPPGGCPPQQGTYTLPGRLRAEFDVEGLKADLLSDMAADPRFRGRDGVDGKPGRDGIDGSPGRDGAAGQVTQEHLTAISQALYQQMQSDPTFRGPAGESVDPDTMTQMILARLPETPVETIDPETGDVSELGTLRIGDTFRIPFQRGATAELGARAPSRHMVLVADKTASYWPALSQLLDRARGHHSGIKVADPPEFAVALPQVVGYRDGLPIKTLATGYSEVSALLTSIVSNRFEENW